MSLIEKARPRGIPDDDEVRRPRRRRWRYALLLLALAAALAALWWLRVDKRGLEPAPAPVEEPVIEPPPLGAAAPEPIAPEASPAPEAEAAPPAEPLPEREGSDALVRGLAGDVSRDPLVVGLAQRAGLIDGFVLIVDNLAEGDVPRKEFASLRPKGTFAVLGSGPSLRIDPASYRRYDALAAAIASIDAPAAAAAYRRVAPLCEESYRALGYPEGGFEQRLRAALVLLLSTPLPDVDPAVIPETKRFEFADPQLESLSDAQKQLLRMGPANAKRVRAKLREIEAALGS
jgi:hypothetical protein